MQPNSQDFSNQGQNYNQDSYQQAANSQGLNNFNFPTKIVPQPQIPEPKVKKPKKKIDWIHWILIFVLTILLGLCGWLYFYVYINRGSFAEKTLSYNSFSNIDFDLNKVSRKEPLPKSITNLDAGMEAQKEQFRRLNANFLEVRPTVDPGLYKTFSGENFKTFTDNFKHPDTVPTVQKPFIRNNPQVDAKIQELAEGRGYKLRPQINEEALVNTGSQRLHPQASQNFNNLKTEALKEGIDLIFTSGYRSVAEQRTIFLNAIQSITNEQIIAGGADLKIDAVLATTSIPGYSRHHSGYTVDIACSDGQISNFKNTPCYQWISAYNYLNAKRFGFVPSYPEEAQKQGPEPEAWEYVFVGQPSLRR
jgi:LAS superfamily LD-carboxypeptidase LdcB